MKKVYLRDIKGFQYEAETEDGRLVVGSFDVTAESHDFSEVTVETAIDSATKQELNDIEFDLWDLADQISETGDPARWYTAKHY